MPRPRPQTDGISRAGNGRYKLRLVVGGKVIKRTFSRREEAEHARDEIRRRATALSLGIAPPAPVAVPTLGSVLDGYRRECETLRRSPAHLKSIDLARKYLVEWAGEARPASLTRGDLVGFVAWMRRETKSKGRAIHNALVILRTSLRLAELPVPAAPRLELPARVPKTLPKEGLLALLAELPLGSLARTAVELGLWTGARAAELFRLRLGDVDLERGTLVLRRAKGRPGRRGSEETVPIPPPLRSVLEAYLVTRKPPCDVTDDPFLVCRGRPLGHSSLRRTLEAACVRAGVPTRSTVGWTRAQVTTLLREARATLRDVARFDGHEDEAVTRAHYDESNREAEERWNARVRLASTLSATLGDGYDLGTPETENVPQAYPLEADGAAKSSGINGARSSGG